MYEKALALNIKDFIVYLGAVALIDPSLGSIVEQANGLLEEPFKKAEDGTFSKEDARELQGMFTKGIGDWMWPSAFAGEVDKRIANLCGLAYAEEVA